MELINNLIIRERKGCSGIITITPRKVVVDKDNNQVTDMTSSTKSLDEVENSCDSTPSDQKEEADTQSRSDKLRSIKQELEKKLSQLLHQQASKVDKPKETESMTCITPSKAMFKWICSSIIPSKAMFKWMIIVLNVIIELIQAVYTQDESSRKISKGNYCKLSVIMASICLTISIVDIIFEAWEGEVKWRKRGICPWFYYPGKHGRVFGSFWVVFGLVSSMVQFWVSLVSYVTHGSGWMIGFDYLPLLLAVCFLLAALGGGGGRKSVWVVVKCDIKHGEYEIEGRFVRGSWCFACPSCETAVRSV